MHHLIPMDVYLKVYFKNQTKCSFVFLFNLIFYFEEQKLWGKKPEKKKFRKQID